MGYKNKSDCRQENAMFRKLYTLDRLIEVHGTDTLAGRTLVEIAEIVEAYYKNKEEFERA